MENDQSTPIGTWLRETRLSRELTQEQLADLSGVSQQTIAKIERGKIRFSKQFPKLLAVLGVSGTDFSTDIDRLFVQQATMREVAEAKRVLAEHPDPDQKMMVFGLQMGPDGQFWDFKQDVGSFDKIQQLIAGPKVAAMYVAEETMSPAIEPGDVVVVNSRLPALPGTDCAFIGDNDEGEPWLVAFRRLIKADENAWTVEQFSPRRTYELRRSQYQSARRIVAIYRRP
ncbi:helix-turn-helix domain-containing protein [Bosea massiliensis]|uniref:Helix-turn-helix domain-containing protein n=1 Tax=Bosea massiliensis TaxID=151419 RepID=A0ABW0P0K3_9HYPH